MLFIVFKYLFSVHRYSSFRNMQISSDDVIHATKFCLNVMKRDISANLYQKSLILCSKILLHVLHNMSLTVLLPWQHVGSMPPHIKSFSGHLWHSILIFAESTSYA